MCYHLSKNARCVEQGRRPEAIGSASLAGRAKGTRPGRLTFAVPAELRDWSGQLRRSAAGGAESRKTVNINIYINAYVRMATFCVMRTVFIILADCQFTSKSTNSHIMNFN